MIRFVRAQEIAWMSGLLLAVICFNGCAAIMGGGSSQPVLIEAQQHDATFSIKSSSGLLMGSGPVPGQMRLPRKNEYQIDISLDGYEPQTVVLTKSINGWIWGNLVFGWVVGFAIDFITGAAYKLEPALVSVTLQTALMDTGEDTLYAVIHFYGDDGGLIEERRVEMTPDSCLTVLPEFCGQ